MVRCLQSVGGFKVQPIVRVAIILDYHEISYQPIDEADVVLTRSIHEVFWATVDAFFFLFDLPDFTSLPDQ